MAIVAVPMPPSHVRIHAAAADVLADVVDDQQVDALERDARKPALGQDQHFFLSFENEITLPTLSMSSYLSLTIHLLFAFGLVFELPTIAFILTRIGLINAGWLRKNRKYALVVIFIAAAILTPPDIFTQTLMAGPLIILYEISVFVSWMARSRDIPASSPEGSAA